MKQENHTSEFKTNNNRSASAKNKIKKKITGTLSDSLGKLKIQDSRSKTNAKKSVRELKAKIIEMLPGAMCKVKLIGAEYESKDIELIAYTAGRIKKSRIRVVVGDIVTIEVQNRGRITDSKARLVYRHKLSDS
ncbi:MAG: translation initiation factor IF-1 domain protein [Candidatus Xenolissoclinum pacificiensis L6]|uniref:Translation initiation factor IF-1 domain protein n=1 Tax=Candidatus Xenolissoclinum pacificiensis L6 TaxID=1401685 RepID=W2V0Y0_9RICK|nr:MAG: translation initiation factor IF-1 domain protein [Candidatus Xenolissoclinum pacificiensis L6]